MVNYFVENAKSDPRKYSTEAYDGLLSHTMHVEALKFLNVNRTIAVYTPTHSSHLFNVEDVTVFAKLKASSKRRQTRYLIEKNRNLTVQDFPHLFKAVWDDVLNQNAIISCKVLLILDISFPSFQKRENIPDGYELNLLRTLQKFI